MKSIVILNIETFFAHETCILRFIKNENGVLCTGSNVTKYLFIIESRAKHACDLAGNMLGEIYLKTVFV